MSPIVPHGGKESNLHPGSLSRAKVLMQILSRFRALNLFFGSTAEGEKIVSHGMKACVHYLVIH